MAMLQPGYFMVKPVAQTSKSAVSRVSKPADATQWRHPADLEIGDTAGLETCATPVLPAPVKAAMKYPGLTPPDAKRAGTRVPALGRNR
jgi:hypothetical protein